MTRSAPIDDWIQSIADTASHIYDAAPIVEIIYRSFMKNQNVVCINCHKPGLLKRDQRQGIPINDAFLEIF